jgi:hypothetical protein
MTTHEWAAVPTGVLGKRVDALLKERDDLDLARHEAVSDMLAAERVTSAARKADREAYRDAIRSGSSKDPGKTNEVKAENAEQAAKRRVAAVREALAANSRDIVAALQEDAGEILGNLAVAQQEDRMAAMACLEELSRLLQRWQSKQQLSNLVSQPMASNGDDLRTYTVAPLRVDKTQIGGGGERLTVQSLLDLVARQLEISAPSATARAAAFEAWGSEVEFSSVERLVGGTIQIRGVSITLAEHDLIRYRFRRGALRCDLLVSAVTDLTSSLSETFRSARYDIDAAFEQHNPVVAGKDTSTTEVLRQLIPARVVVDPEDRQSYHESRFPDAADRGVEVADDVELVAA